MLNRAKLLPHAAAEVSLGVEILVNRGGLPVIRADVLAIEAELGAIWAEMEAIATVLEVNSVAVLVRRGIGVTDCGTGGANSRRGDVDLDSVGEKVIHVICGEVGAANRRLRPEMLPFDVGPFSTPLE